MIQMKSDEYEDGKHHVQVVDYCGTDGEITALCVTAVRKASEMMRIPPERVLTDMACYWHDMQGV